MGEYSKLATSVDLSPNCTKPRVHKISRLTPHCVAGDLSYAGILSLPRFKKYNSTQGASCNYAIDSRGRLGVGVYEDNRSWCSSSSENDHRAITVEIANDGGAPSWHMAKDAIGMFKTLAIDICTRYGYKGVVYKPKPSSVGIKQVESWIKTWEKKDYLTITLHCWFKNKVCPGPYLMGKLPTLVKEINNTLHPTKKESYQVVITCDTLNVRSGPGTNYKVTTKVHKGWVFTIKSTKGHWGELISGAGWIHLGYTEKVN